MTEPEYKRAFAQEDFRGYFTWTKKLSSRFQGNLYHACHEEELKSLLENDELGLRSEWALNIPQHGQWSAPGTWVGLNYFNNGNYYGPFLLTFPISVLNNRHFMVFRRHAGDRKRFFFVQYEARIPVYSFGKNIWRNVNPAVYFKNGQNDDIWMSPGAIYDIVITQPIPLLNATVSPINHPSCISNVCNGMTLRQSKRKLKVIAVGEVYYWLAENEDYKQFFKKFQVLDGAEIELFDPEDID